MTRRTAQTGTPERKRPLSSTGRRRARRGDIELPGFAKLPKTEQIGYLQALWDRIAEQPDELPVPGSHLEVAEERLADFRRAASRARLAHDIINRLKTRG